MALGIIAFVFGLLFGSFLNVCISRLPRHRSLISPRSHCPRCNAVIRWYDNIPLLSYAILRARCRVCGTWISPRYPLVELSVAVAWLACAISYGPTLRAAEIAIFCWLLVGLFVTDIETYTLPDALTFPGIAAGLVFDFGLAPADHRFSALGHAVLTAAIFCGIFLVTRWLYWVARHEEGIGLGDIKLLALLSVFLLLRQTAVAVFVAIVAASLFSLLLLARRRTATVKSRISFGAFLAIGGVVSAFAGARIFAWYLNFF